MVLFVKVIGNHFQCPPTINLQEFCLSAQGFVCSVADILAPGLG